MRRRPAIDVVADENHRIAVRPGAIALRITRQLVGASVDIADREEPAVCRQSALFAGVAIVTNCSAQRLLAVPQFGRALASKSRDAA